MIAGIATLAMLIAASDYGALVRDYRSGDAGAAIASVAALDRWTLVEGFDAFAQTMPSADLLAAAAAMETEIALSTTIKTSAHEDEHLKIAAAIVELGTPRRLRRYGTAVVKSPVAVSPQFQRLWFLAAITAMEFRGRITPARQLLENARLLFPHDPDVLLLSAITEEMAASNRLVNTSDGDRRKALGYAEVYLRESMELAPGRLETKLRLGRVLAQRGRLDEARTLLTAVSDTRDTRLSYLACLFLGGIEDEAGHTAAAAAWYTRAGDRLPSAQAARIAASELRHRAGERQEAARELPSAIGPANSTDPWWAYLFGEFWRLDLYLDALRKMSRS